ncbi:MULTISPECIES: hypothetical protein [Azohydromonas]|jgi:hypothetical protein|uniref:Copper resistance protein n=1 Tax=Azohydromonas lata TaxID=45677 RepID=A0ABU5I9D5_9BURK|nr:MULTISPECIES: hypothetical protein [Azohydromonas]MDZ5455713.1 hypothetical protein [Azohydromonas lata]
MFLTVRHRRSLASWLAAFVLLVQLVTAAYACPQAKVPSAPMPADAVLMHDCDGDMHATMDPDQPQLCKAHCDQGTASVTPQPGTEPGAALAALPVLLWVVPVLAVSPSVAARSRPPTDGAPRGSPPIYLSHLSLRN